MAHAEIISLEAQEKYKNLFNNTAHSVVSGSVNFTSASRRLEQALGRQLSRQELIELHKTVKNLKTTQ